MQELNNMLKEERKGRELQREARLGVKKVGSSTCLDWNHCPPSPFDVQPLQPKWRDHESERPHHSFIHGLL